MKRDVAVYIGWRRGDLPDRETRSATARPEGPAPAMTSSTGPEA